MKIAYLATCLLLPFKIHAEALVVSADRILSERDSTSNEVYLISKDQLEKSRGDFLWKEIIKAPGVTLSNNGGNGQTTTINIRGADTRHTLVLIDNVELNDASTTGNLADLSQIGTSGIEEVEILPGSQSVLYGSDAIGGVVKLKTINLENVKRPHVEYSGSYGSNNSFTTGLTHYNRTGKTAYYIDATQFTTEGINQTSIGNNDNSETDEYFRFAVTSKVEHELNHNHSFKFLGKFSSSTTDLDKGFGATRDDSNYTSDGRNILLQAELESNFLEGRLNTQFGFNWINNKRDDLDEIDNLSSTISTFKSRFTRKKSYFQGDYYLTDSDILISGFEFESEAGQTETLSSGSLSGMDRSTDESIAAYALYKRTGTLFWSSGLRFQSHEENNKTTFKVAPGISINNTKIWTSFSTGFKNPSLFQRKSSSFGNENLNPEESKSFEIGVEREFLDVFSGSLTLFHLDIKNLIDTEGTFPNIRYVNIDSAEVSGLNLVINSKYAGASMTIQSTEDQDGKELINRPKVTRRFFVKLPYESFEFYLENFYKGERDSGSTFSRSRERSFHLFNAKLSYDYRKTMLIWLDLNNLLSRSYTDITNFNTDGFNFRLGFNWRY